MRCWDRLRKFKKMKLSLFTLIAFLQMATKSNAKLQLGEPCDTKNACASDLYCDEGTDKCRRKTYANLGAACDKKTGTLCKQGICEDKKCCIKDDTIITQDLESKCCSGHTKELKVGQGKKVKTTIQCGD